MPKPLVSSDGGRSVRIFPSVVDQLGDETGASAPGGAKLDRLHISLRIQVAHEISLGTS